MKRREFIGLMFAALMMLGGKIKMNKVIHRAKDRGSADHGWLKSFHTFSFANYHNPQMMGFGTLRVINDDTIEAGHGFGTHPHRDMEIISVPLEGALEHKDSMGNQFVIKKGEIQVMSAGTGITHSEYNHSKEEVAKLLQIWVLPKNKGIEPRYEQRAFAVEQRQNKFQLIVSGDGEGDSLKINQAAAFALANLQEGKSVAYKLKNAEHGVYLFVISGEVGVADEKLGSRDAIALTSVADVSVKALKEAEVLLMEVPM